ncbi:hypothetical protein H2199_007151 [Coniosporium tulheliwenetii]|uniref:Uncharacterized protein n=1 Tax=Coniosporium tulheliwenetii TaxID=3383036 RepID=A0ACC2YR85_9PEZI|nr:hypothetical protein H2199_007151 [Cladosporium sp. JES 115]
MLFASYFDNWRWYFRYLGDPFTEINNPAMVVEPEKEDAKSSFLRVQSLRNTIDFVLFARACCIGDLDVVKKLKSSNIESLSGMSDLESQATSLEDYISSSESLQGRLRNAIDLVGYTLTLHNQLETAKVDKELRDMTKKLGDVTEEMRNLTQDTVDDSATVKIITFVSAFYLPGSFVATIFGMNFFDFDVHSRSITIAHDFWVFIATWLPLTFITGALYMVIVWYDLRGKGKLFRWPWQQRGKKQ